MLIHLTSVFKLQHKGRSSTVLRFGNKREFFKKKMYKYQYSTLIFTPILFAVAIAPSAAA